MRVLITLQHPAHVHFYRPVVDALDDHGHDVRVFYRDEELVGELLDRYGIEGVKLAPRNRGRIHAYANQIRYELALLRRARAIGPDVLTAIGGIAAAHVALLVGARSVIFDDSGSKASLNRLGAAVADVVCTPEAEDCDYGTAQIEYPGYHELAYLHPNRFEPDRAALEELGVDVDGRYFVLRFIAWNAQHDHGQRGLSREARARLVAELDERGEVYVTTEGEPPEELRDHALPVPPEMAHDLLAFADLYVGDSQTMATEAAVLGTPAVRCNTFATAADMGNFVELEEEYGLLYSTTDEGAAIERALAWADDDLATAWQEKRAALLADKIDVAAFARDVILGRASAPPRATLPTSTPE